MPDAAVCHLLKQTWNSDATAGTAGQVFFLSQKSSIHFTKQELAAIFRKIDCWETTPYSRGNSAIMDPLIFRMAYGCGMRIMEILTLRCADVDSDSSTIHIRHGKNGHERQIPMAASLAHRCLKYKKSIYIGNKA
jgi:integrase/recombinase XerD